MTRRSPLWILLSLAVPLSVAVAAPFVATSALAEPPPADAPAEAEAPPEAAPVALDARFQRFVLAPHGDVVGVVLDNGNVVRVSPRAFREAPAALKAGDALHIEGVPAATPTGTVFERAVVQLDGKVLSDTMKRHGHHHRHGKGEHGKGEHGKRHEKRAELQPVRAAGRIAALVSGPRGHVHAVLLDDGTSATGFGMDKLGLKVGDRVTVAGMGGAYTQGKAMRITTITLPSGETRELPKPDWKARRHAKEGEPGTPA